MLGMFTLDSIKIQALKLLGDRAAFTAANLATIEFADRCYFSGGTGKKSFITNIHLITSDAFFPGPEY